MNTTAWSQEEQRLREDLFSRAQYIQQVHAPSEMTNATSQEADAKLAAAEAARAVADAAEKTAAEKAAAAAAGAASTMSTVGGKGGGESNNSTSRPALNMTVGEHGCGVICSLQ